MSADVAQVTTKKTTTTYPSHTTATTPTAAAGETASSPLLATTTTTTTTKKVPASSPWSSYFGPSSTFRRHQQRWVLGATVLGLSLLVALTAISLSRAIGSSKHAMDYAGDKARMAYDRYQPSQFDQMGDTAAHLRQQGDQWYDQAKQTGKHWWSKWSPWLDSAQDKIQEGNEMAREKLLLEPKDEGMFMRAYHYLFSRSEADEAALRARQYANEARDAIRPTVWERMKHALGQSSPEEQLKFFADSGIDEAGNIIDRAKFDTWEKNFNDIKQHLYHEPTLSERFIQHLYPTPTAEEIKDQAQDKLQDYYDSTREAAHPTLWARFKNAFGMATPLERAQILASAGLDESGRIIDRTKFQAYQSYLYAKDQAQLFADETKSRLHPSLWARVKHAMGKASPSEMAQIYAIAGLDEAGNIIDQAKFTAWETATKLKSASMDVVHKPPKPRSTFWLYRIWDGYTSDDLAQRADRMTRPPTLWERLYYTFHHEPTWSERADDVKQTLDEYYDRTREAIHPSLWARFKHAFGHSTPTERAQIYAAAGLDEAGNIIDKAKFTAYQGALKARDQFNIYADRTQQALHPSAWARFKNLFGRATPLERAQIYSSAGLDEAGNIVDKAKFAAWEQAVRLRGAAYDVAHNLHDTLYPPPSFLQRLYYTFIHEPTTTERAQDLAARGWYATRDAAQQAYEAARDAVTPHEPTLGERISGLFRHKPTASERARLYAEQAYQNAQDAALAARDKLYPEPTLGQKIRHLFVREDTPAERARYLAAAGLDQAGNIIDKAKFKAWEQALKIKAAAYDATHPTVWERTKSVFVEPTPQQKAKLYAAQMWDTTSDTYDKLKHQYASEPSTLEKIKDYLWHEPTYTERARDYFYDTFYREPTFGERISSAFSGSQDLRPRLASSLHGTADSLRATEPTLTDRMKAAAKEKVADALDEAGHRVHHEPSMTERAQEAAQKIRDSIVGAPPSESTFDKIRSAVLPNHDDHVREQEKEQLRKKAHEAIDKSMK